MADSPTKYELEQKIYELPWSSSLQLKLPVQAPAFFPLKSDVNGDFIAPLQRFQLLF